MSNCRTIRPAHTVQSTLEQIYGSAERADTASNGIFVILAVRPECGEKVTDSIWFIATEASGVWVATSIYYKFDENIVDILHIEQTESA